MQLWQTYVMGGVDLEDGTELKVVTGIDDHSRFCVAAGLVTRAISKAVCEVLSTALVRQGRPHARCSHPDQRRRWAWNGAHRATKQASA